LRALLQRDEEQDGPRYDGKTRKPARHARPPAATGKRDGADENGDETQLENEENE
jgi:hypothetical protein